MPSPFPLSLSLSLSPSSSLAMWWHLVAASRRGIWWLGLPNLIRLIGTALPYLQVLPYLSYTNLRLRGTTTNYDYMSTSLSAPSALTTDSETYII